MLQLAKRVLGTLSFEVGFYFSWGLVGGLTGLSSIKVKIRGGSAETPRQNELQQGRVFYTVLVLTAALIRQVMVKRQLRETSTHF